MTQIAETAASSRPMVTIGSVTLGQGRPKIIVPITATTLADATALARDLAPRHDVDLVELRIDALDAYTDAQAVVDVTKAVAAVLTRQPLIVTMRTKPEGGRADLADADYAAILRHVLTVGACDAIDIELTRAEAATAPVVALAGQRAKPVIMSRHHFDRTPPEADIVDSLLRMQARGADVLKIATMPHGPQDLLTLLSATWATVGGAATRPVISMAMGGVGVLSRLSGEVFGSVATFGKVGAASAPGQIDAALWPRC